MDYTDQAGDRHIETFAKKKDADSRHDAVRQDVRKGIHVAASKSITVAEAGERWLADAANRLERATCKTYAEHVNIHIVPLLGRTKLSEISVPVIAQFKKNLLAKKVKPPLIRKIVVRSARSSPTRRRTVLPLTTPCAISVATRSRANEAGAASQAQAQDRRRHPHQGGG